ncbi:MAG: HEAT repeat domain-containing protein [Ignavibacteriaceae bacterium]
MTHYINKTVKIAAVVLAAVLLSGNVFAKNNNLTNMVTSEIPEVFVKNLALGLTSDCSGLKKSCIYFAGFYEIEGMVNPLANQFAKETDPNTRVLIALALYKIGTPEAIKTVERLVKNELDPKVKRIGMAILNELQFNSGNLNITKY